MDELDFGLPEARAHKPAKRERDDWITAYCDGGSRGNPGPSGFGVYIEGQQGAVVAELSEYLGRKTNNFAEYSGMLAALQFAIDEGHDKLRVISDSELMVKQMKGQYRVNSPELRPLYDEAKRRVGKLVGFQIQHVLREKNKRADGLANLAMDRGMGRTATSQQSSAQNEIPIVRVASERKSSPLKPIVKSIRGFVKGGVVHLVEGELPDGVFVKIVRE